MLSGGAVARVGVFVPIIHFGHGGSCCCLEKFCWHRNSTWAYVEKVSICWRMSNGGFEWFQLGGAWKQLLSGKE